MYQLATEYLSSLHERKTNGTTEAIRKASTEAAEALFQN